MFDERGSPTLIHTLADWSKRRGATCRRQRLVLYCRTTSASTAPCTSRGMHLAHLEWLGVIVICAAGLGLLFRAHLLRDVPQHFLQPPRVSGVKGSGVLRTSRDSMP